MRELKIFCDNCKEQIIYPKNDMRISFHGEEYTITLLHHLPPGTYTIEKLNRAGRITSPDLCKKCFTLLVHRASLGHQDYGD